MLQVRKLLLKNSQSPGDIVMLTAAVRDLHKTFPGRFITDVATSCMQIWENNPYIIKLDKHDPSIEVINCEYPMVHRSNEVPYHFIHGFAEDLSNKLGINFPLTQFKGDIHISDKEKSWISQIEELGINKNFWIIVAGGKRDFTAKWWNPKFYQDVVDHFKDKIVFVQTGEKHHFHQPLNGVIDLLGKTDIRQFIRLVYHSIGVLCPVTFAMHAAAAVPVKKDGLKNRPCVVVAGGREPVQWEMYPHHKYLSTNGTMPCCANGGCWKSRCQQVGDGDIKDKHSLCTIFEQLTPELRIPKCMYNIKPDDVIKAIESYYNGGVLNYAD
jgi:ADP-heptose:LPS heptosyltransferase